MRPVRPEAQAGRRQTGGVAYAAVCYPRATAAEIRSAAKAAVALAGPVSRSAVARIEIEFDATHPRWRLRGADRVADRRPPIGFDAPTMRAGDAVLQGVTYVAGGSVGTSTLSWDGANSHSYAYATNVTLVPAISDRSRHES